jgi:hypothetical protein
MEGEAILKFRIRSRRQPAVRLQVMLLPHTISVAAAHRWRLSLPALRTFVPYSAIYPGLQTRQ